MESWDTLLLYILSSKLDFSSKLDWEDRIKSGSLPTLQDFSNFLTSRCQLQENVYSRTINKPEQRKSFNQKPESKSFSPVSQPTNKLNVTIALKIITFSIVKVS